MTARPARQKLFRSPLCLTEGELRIDLSLLWTPLLLLLLLLLLLHICDLFCHRAEANVTELGL